MSSREYLTKFRNNGCPLHGFHISNSLVKYSGYCNRCNQFWRFHRAHEMKRMPYWWYYFDPETKKLIGKVFKGKADKEKLNLNVKITIERQ